MEAGVLRRTQACQWTSVIVILAFLSFPTFNHLDDLSPLGLGIPSGCGLVKGAANEVGIHQADGNGGGLIVTATVPRFVRKRRGTYPSIIDQTVERQE
jgi:hypothetical protein